MISRGEFLQKVARTFWGPKKQPSLVIVGAGFAGMSAALALPRHYRVTVLDSHPSFEFLPNIHELISGFKKPAELRLSRRELLRRAGHTFYQERVVALDPLAQTLRTEQGRTLDYDFALVAVGGIDQTFGLPGVLSYTMPFKTVDHCAAIGQRLHQITQNGVPSSVVIVGGGLEGIEALGEILRRYRKIPQLHLHVVEGRQQLLPQGPPVIDREVRRHCQPFPVSFHTNTRVSEIAPRQVHLSNGESLDADLVLWTGGITAPPLLFEAGLAPEKGQWAPTRPTLQSLLFDSLFLAGDAAQPPLPLSKQAYHAMDMGALLAKNIERSLAGRPLLTFRPSHKPTLLSFGDLDSFLITGETVLAGTALAAAKEAVYQLSMARFAPPRNLASSESLVARALTGSWRLALSQLSSHEALRRLPQLRILR